MPCSLARCSLLFALLVLSHTASAQLDTASDQVAAATKSATQATPPRQPLLGPGGSTLAHRQVRKTYYGSGGQAYWLFEPASPTPKIAPVIVFNHGWSATNPQIYGAWIDHLAQRGNIVIFPRYQADLTTPPTEWTPNAIAGIKAALQRLQTETGHVKPDLARFALVGHSVGGVLSANEAALGAKNGLPRARAVMSVQPGITWSIPQVSIPLADLKAIPAQTLLLSVAGQSDNFVKDIDAKRIFNEATQVPSANKDYIVLPTDTHGFPPLLADHFAPCAADESYDDGEEAKLAAQAGGTGEQLQRSRVRERRQTTVRTSRAVNALDYGLWRLFDALCDAAFTGKNRAVALGNTPQQRALGRWSDGVAVKELTVTNRPQS